MNVARTRAVSSVATLYTSSPLTAGRVAMRMGSTETWDSRLAPANTTPRTREQVRTQSRGVKHVRTLLTGEWPSRWIKTT